MAKVGGSIGCAGSARSRRSADRVGDGGLLRPARATMSPASASSTGTRSRPRKARILVMRPVSTNLPSRRQRLDRHVGLDRAGLDAAGQHAAEIGVGFQQSSPAWRRARRHRPSAAAHACSDQVEQRRQVLFAARRANLGPALLGRRRTGSGNRAARRWRPARRTGRTLRHDLSARASGRSTLLMTTIGLRPSQRLADDELGLRQRAFGGVDQHDAPSTIDRMRSTSPPKSAWPGVSTILMRRPSTPPRCIWPGW